MRILENREQVENVDEIAIRQYDDLVANRPIEFAQVEDIPGWLPGRAAVCRSGEVYGLPERGGIEITHQTRFGCPGWGDKAIPDRIYVV
jgi:hypothetical protein